MPERDARRSANRNLVCLVPISFFSLLLPLGCGDAERVGWARFAGHVLLGTFCWERGLKIGIRIHMRYLNAPLQS